MLRFLLALIAAALFTGTALAASLAEPQARASLERRTGALMLVLALVSLALGAWGWWRSGFVWLLGGAALMGAAFLLSLFARRAGGMPGVRAALGLAAVAAYLMAFVQP
jgi:hypothetical protein